MFPWTSAKGFGKALEAGETVGVRSAEAMAAELDELRKLAKAETDFDGVALSTEDRMAKSHIARALADASMPPGSLELRRIWRDLDAVMGPGQSVLQSLTARYPRLAGASDRMARQLRRCLRANRPGAHKIALSRMKSELTRFATLRDEILTAVRADSKALQKALALRLADKEFAELLRASGGSVPKVLTTLSVDELVAQSRAALESMQNTFLAMREAAATGKDARVAAKAWEKAAREEVEALRGGHAIPRDAELVARIQALARLGHPVDMGTAFAKRMRTALRKELPLLGELRDTDRVFQEALGIVAQAKGKKAERLRRFVERGPQALTAKELERVEGYVNQLRGLMPEAAAMHMQFMEGVFHKRAFEALADFPPSLRGQMSVEMIEGPLWVVGGSAPPSQLGDGCMLLSGPGGQSAIVGLGEYKAGFNKGLLHQLFVRTDGRAVSAQIEFRGLDGRTERRMLTREFTFPGGRKQALREPPLYVYGRPGGASVETEELFRRMVDEQMQSGREMYKVQLPFSATQNTRFAERSLQEAVKTMRKLDPDWGR